MLIKKRILGVKGGSLQMATTGHQPKGITARASRVEAGMGSMAGINNPNVSTTMGWNSEYTYYMTGLLDAGNPAFADTRTLALFNRDIYLYDNTAGSAVDIQSSFPFSDFELRGLPKEELQPFVDAVEQLNIRRMMPKISWAYLTDGFFCGSLVFDPVRRQFLDTWVHDALHCSLTHSPMYNMDPEIQVNTESAAKILASDNPFIKRYMRMMPESFLQLIRSGRMALDPVATLFIPRESMTDRPYVSYLQRILPMYLIEKAMFRGTLTEAHRRQRAMTHITAGDDLWTPTSEELMELVQQFQTAEFDPLGGWVGTRNSVQSTDLRPAGDFWKWTDMTDVMVAYKLRALGISEAFLSGDASFAAADNAYSAFLETQSSYRGFLTDKTFYQKIFPLIAATNGLFRDKEQVKNVDQMDYLFDARLKANLKIPTVYWHKKLDAEPTESLSEMLTLLDEKGVPVPLKMWMTAAGQDPDVLLRELEEDAELRRRLEEVTGKDTSHDQDYDEDFDVDASTLVNAALGQRKIPLLAREFGEAGEVYETTPTGKRKYVYNQRAAKAKQNNQIMRAALKMQDPNERARVRKMNIERFGTHVIPGLLNRR